MDWAGWSPTYEAILKDLGYDRKRDEQARDLLDALLEHAAPVDVDALRARVRGREAFVVGGAATRDDVERIPPGSPILVADAACSLVVPVVRPDAIVTDLDGDVPLQVAANALGVPVFLHAHGDNMDALRAHARAFRGPIMGTTQAAPTRRIQNHGGFTDGDRACCLAVWLGASGLALVGFDYTRAAPKPGLDEATKLRKLAWARRIVEGLGVPTRNA